ncbi:hypothetical protein ANN_27978 [Periplaneta americana]|uniref:Endonuclease/exonuclease/phosphatase domain-containing protein n=1 Tax=Periplaneta americana TaxID=6978 RepID=A0ABQ8RUK1_PERAM|nr:hypothetical protein ANN_27978 [Periplaneta americana]
MTPRARSNRPDTNKQERKNLRMILWNTEGLTNALSLTTLNFLQKYDLAIFTETFLTKEWGLENFYSINNLATQSKLGRPKGGISCLITPSFSPFETQDKSEHILAIKTKICTIVGTYFQPEIGETDIIDEIITALSRIQKREPVIIAKDLNCRMDVSSKKTEAIFAFLAEEGFTLINIEAVIQFRASREEKTDKRVRISREINLSKLQETNTQHIIQTIQSNSPNEGLAAIENCIREATTPATPQSRRAKPWFNQTCYRKRKETIAALHEAKVHESEAKLKNYAAKRREYKELIKRTREEFRHEEEKKMIEDVEKDPFKASRLKQPHFPRNIPIEL